jgi:hypothetical protein
VGEIANWYRKSGGDGILENEAEQNSDGEIIFFDMIRITTVDNEI